LFVLQQLEKPVVRHVFDRLHSAAVKEHRHRDQAEGDHDEDDAAPIKIGFAPSVSILSLRVTIELSHKQKKGFYRRKNVTMNKLAMQSRASPRDSLNGYIFVSENPS
jgi:hypothetical protein